MVCLKYYEPKQIKPQKASNKALLVTLFKCVSLSFDPNATLLI